MIDHAYNRPSHPMTTPQAPQEPHSKPVKKACLAPIVAAIRQAPAEAWRQAAPAPEQPIPKPPAQQKRAAADAAPTVGQVRHRQAEIVKTIGARLKAARELNNLSLSEAAQRLGYSNPSKLSKVENATDTNSVPLWLIRDAAKLYDVSCDYIYGLADDWETGVPRGVSIFLLDQWDAMRKRDMAVLTILSQRLEVATGCLPKIESQAGEILEAFQRVIDLNPEYQDLRGGARLSASAESLRKTASDATSALRKLDFQRQPEAATTE